MGINTPHRELSKYLDDYTLIRTLIAGDRAVKSAGEKYVPRLSGNSNEEYNAYISRPSYENYVARVQDGLCGLAFAKPAQFTYPASLQNIVDDISLSDLSLNDFSTEFLREVLTVGRCGMLIDFPNVGVQTTTVAQLEQMNIRPYAKIYKSESIINWRYKTVNNVQTIDMVILAEDKEKWVSDYESEIETIYRVLIMRDGVYTQEIFSQTDKDKYSVTEVYVPMVKGKPLNYIPFLSVTPDKITLSPAKPPMIDLANVNLSHFKLLVDFYHGAHFTALPTANFFVGNLPDDTTIKLGASTANVFNDPNGHAEYLEFQGGGLSTLSAEKDVLVNRMAALGARFLSESKRVAETQESQETRSSGERAILVSAVTTVSHAITKMLNIMAEMMGVSGDISYKLNTDYNLTSMDSALMRELLNGLTIGAITDRIFYENLKKGEIIEEGYTFEDYQNDKEAMQAQLSFTPATSTDDNA